MSEHVSSWNLMLNKEEGRNGSNKLRLYRLFKQDYCTEVYINSNMPRSYRSALAKFRCGVAPIRIETGRYEKLLLENRKCFNCNEVEDEIHVLFHCVLYDYIRESLFNECIVKCPTFLEKSDADKLCFLFSKPDLCFNLAKICFLILTRRKHLLYC